MTVAYSSEFRSSDYLHVNSCYRQELFGKTVGSLRENGRRDYLLLYVAEGCLFLYEDGAEKPVNAGSAVLYKPYERQEYLCKAEIKSVVYSVHFSGTACETVLEGFGITGRVFSVGKVSRAEELFGRIGEELLLKRPFADKLCAGYFYSILVLFGRKIRLSEPANPKMNGRIEQVCRDMIRHYSREIDVASYAADCHLSVSRFVHVFKEITGTSPANFIIAIRIKKACELLENTDLTVLQIAQTVGIDDQNYFSRLFKKRTGLAPSAYRKNCL